MKETISDGIMRKYKYVRKYFNIFSQISYDLHISYDWPSYNFMGITDTQKQCVSYILNYINFDPNDF